MAARAIWKGELKLGTTKIPVKLYSGVTDRTVRFHILDDKHLMRVKQHMVSPDSGEEGSTADAFLVTASAVTRCTIRQELHVSTTMRSGSTRLTVKQSGCTDQHCWRKAPLRIISAIDRPHTEAAC